MVSLSELASPMVVLPFNVVAPLTIRALLNVLSPPNVCEPVVTNPLAVVLALGILSVTVPPNNTGLPDILKSVPDVPAATVIVLLAREELGIPVSVTVFVPAALSLPFASTVKLGIFKLPFALFRAE